MIPFDKALFKAPNFSVFDMSHDNKLDMGLGRVVPVFWKYMHPNERIQCEVGNLIRMQPLNGAILQHYDITFDSFFVPARLIFGREKAERFFNLYQSNGTDAWYSGGAIPTFPWDFLIKNSKPGTVLDYLGYPTFPNLRQAVAEFANGVYLSSTNVPGLGSSSGLMDTEVGIAVDGDGFFIFSGESRVIRLRPRTMTGSQSIDVVFPKFFGTHSVGDVAAAYDIMISDDDLPFGFLNWLYFKAGWIPDPDTDSTRYNDFKFNADFYASHSYEEALRNLSVSPEKAVEMYFDYLFDWLISIRNGTLTLTGAANPFYLFVEGLSGDDDNAPTSAPLFAYWRVISDWYFNYNLSDMPEYELYDYIKNLAMVDGGYNYDRLMDENSGSEYEFFYKWSNSFASRVSGPSGGMMDCFRRNWANDYFTSSFRSPQSGNAVPLPSAENSSIVDLRRANVLQELFERVLYSGRKYRDQVRSFFNVVPANSRLDVTEVISREVQPLQISEVTQTNQADLNKMLETPIGAFAGQSQTVGSHKLSDYTSDEHGIFMVLASIRPRAAYFQGVRKELLKSDVYDFLWPQMENIGEQEVINAEIFADFDPLHPEGNQFTQTFGWNRRYSEFMYHPSEVHGDLQNSLDYLHAARKFDTMPQLNVQFGEIRPEDDDLNRVFVYSADERPFIVELYFDCRMIRPLSRYLHYDL